MYPLGLRFWSRQIPVIELGLGLRDGQVPVRVKISA